MKPLIFTSATAARELNKFEAGVKLCNENTVKIFTGRNLLKCQINIVSWIFFNRFSRLILQFLANPLSANPTKWSNTLKKYIQI